MKTMSVTEFKAHALQVLGEVAATREPVRLTKRGKPIAEVVPTAEAEQEKLVLGDMADTVGYLGDVISPTGAEWEATK